MFEPVPALNIEDSTRAELLSQNNSDTLDTKFYIKLSGKLNRIESINNSLNIFVDIDEETTSNKIIPSDTQIILRQCNPSSRCPDLSSYTGEETITFGYIFRELTPDLIRPGDLIEIFESQDSDQSNYKVFVTRYEEIVNE